MAPVENGLMQILLVEDDTSDANHIASLLAQHRLALAPSMDQARMAMDSHRFQVVLLDLELPGTSDEDWLGEVERLSSGVPVVLLTGLPDGDRARQALRAGAQDYLVKGSFDGVTLMRTLRYAIERNHFVSRLAALHRERERVVELLHQALVPGSFRLPPNLEVGQKYVPSTRLSGDYYDAIALPYGRVGLVIVDVAGKGTDAAIDAVRMKAIIQTNARLGFSPAAILGMLNEVLLEADPPDRTVSCFFLQLSPHDGHVRFACGGHEPALVVSSDGGPVRELDNRDMLVGALPGFTYHEREMQLSPGDALLLYTDGLTEARSPDRDFFGLERVKDVLERLHDRSPQVVVDGLHEAVFRFSGGKFSDDLSMLCVRWQGNSS